MPSTYDIANLCICGAIGLPLVTDLWPYFWLQWRPGLLTWPFLLVHASSWLVGTAFDFLPTSLPSTSPASLPFRSSAQVPYTQPQRALHLVAHFLNKQPLWAIPAGCRLSKGTAGSLLSPQLIWYSLYCTSASWVTYILEDKALPKGTLAA